MCFFDTFPNLWGVIIISVFLLKVLDSLRERLGNESRAKMEELLKEGFSQDQVVHLVLISVVVLGVMLMLKFKFKFDIDLIFKYEVEVWRFNVKS